MARSAAAPDWDDWVRRWDAQQESFNPEREHRFSAMLDVLEAQCGRRFTVLDLGSGPGSLSARILRRFPAARVTAVDYDPVVRRIGEGAYGTFGGRLTWVDAKLGAPRWSRSLPRPHYDAAVSTTALHWLTPAQLGRLYSDLARLLGRRGVFLNGDYLPWGSDEPELSRLGARVLKARFPRSRSRVEWGEWKKWWRDARKVPALREAFAEHDRREAGHPSRSQMPLSGHVRRLRAAGFRTIAVVWQDFENRVLYAVG
jgi:SAM-dependent methyltransferase